MERVCERPSVYIHGRAYVYPVSCHWLPLYADKGVTLPLAEKLEEQVLSLPIWLRMSEEVQRQVTEALRACIS